GELEVVAESTLLLKGLGEHLSLSNVVVRDGSASELHRLLEVCSDNSGHRILDIIVHELLSFGTSLLTLLLLANFPFNRLTDRIRNKPLANLSEISSGESDSA
ncbi:hypothetical protein PMAYCL1PPCAC_07171, partial [Pristionchus mayeri]